MKITTVLSSPNIKGNTSIPLKLFEDKATAAGHEVNRINLAKLNIAGCIGCGACQSVADAPGCSQNDDGSILYQGMIDADLTILATPLYCWGFTSIGQAAVERCIALVSGYGTDQYSSLIDGKKLALLVTCGGPEADNVDLLPVVIDRMTDFVKTKVAGKYILPLCTTPDAIKPEADKLSTKMVEELLPK